MPERVGWDQYEIALLIEACELENTNSKSKSELVHTLSECLRKRATRNGVVVDALFRNENGISLQMTKMQYLLTDGIKGLPGASKLFEKIAVLWKKDKETFNEILDEAKKQIDATRIMSDVMKSNKENFIEWIRVQENLKLSPEQIIQTIEESSQYALSHGISKIGFFEMDDPKVFIKACTKLLSQRIFRLFNKSIALNLEKCQIYYKTYLRLVDAQKANDITVKENSTQPQEPTIKHIETNGVGIARVEPSNVLELKDEITLSDKLFTLLCEDSEKNKYGTTLYYLAKQADTDESSAKKILDSAEWAKFEYGRYYFNHSGRNDVQKYCFENPQSLAFSKPISASYFEEVVSEASSWKQLLVDLMRVLYEDYPYQIKEIKGKVFGSARVPLVAGKEQTDLMRVPKEFSAGLFVETNRSAANIMSNLKHIIDICNVDYENIVVLFERKDIENEPKEVTPIIQKPIEIIPVANAIENQNAQLITENDYENWLRESCGLADATVRSYVSAIHSAEQFAKQHMYSDYQIYGRPKHISCKIISQLTSDKDFIIYNQEQHNRFSASFKKFADFVDGKLPVVRDQAEELSSKYPQLYSKLYAASKIYDTPFGLDVAKIATIVSCSDLEKIYEILKNVSLATEVDSGKYSFSKNPIVKISNAEPKDFDKEKYISILLHRYRNGMTFDSIDFDVFREIYEDFYDERIVFDDNELEKRLKLCGVIYKDRLFPAEGIIDSETQEILFNYIERSFSEGNKILYYKAIFEDLSYAFANCFTLSDEEMLKAYIMYTMDRNEYYFFDRYMSVEKNVEIDHSAEIADYLLSVGKPVSKKEVCKALSYIPQDKVNQIISVDSRFLRNAKGEYFHIDIFEISEEEKERIAGYISAYIDENEYAIWTDIWDKIQDEMESFLGNNPYLSALGVRNAISKCYYGRFNFSGAVISLSGKNYEMRDVYQLYAKHHDKFTANDIYKLSKELDTVIYFDALSEISVRVSHDLFVSKSIITFDVEAIDKVIGSFIADDYICIREIDSFLAFPGVGYEWNEYMLESFLKSYSRKFKLINNGSALHNVAGAVVRKNGTIHEFVDACAVVLADGYVELKKDQALKYLADVNMITNRRYKDIDNALQKAKQMRVQKG